jgi:chromosome segregation ATPase
MAVIEKKKLGRKPTLSAENIIETIKKMQKDGDKISPSTIRSKITFGGLTNITTVLEKFLEEEDEANASTIVPLENHVLPPDLEAKINILLSDITQQINNFSLESDQLANNIATKRARSAYETMIDNNRKLVDEQTLTIKIFDEVEARNDELNEKITEIEIRLENEQVKSSALDVSLSKTNDESGRLNLLISEIKVSLSESETKNKSLEKLITKAETRLEGSVTDKEIAVNESTQLRTQLTETSTKFKSSEAIVVQLKSEINALITENAQSISDVQSTNLKLLSELKEIRTEQQVNKEKLITITTQFISHFIKLFFSHLIHTTFPYLIVFNSVS